MARQRTLKPGFFTNEELGDCSPLARLLFAGLWCWGDRLGRTLDRPRRLKAEILPYDTADGEKLVAELTRSGLIRRYEAAGIKVIQIVNFDRHQDPHPRETPSILPNEDGTFPALGEPGADQGTAKVTPRSPRPSKPSSPSQPSRPSQPASPPNPPGPLAGVPGWLAGVGETLGRELGKTLDVGKDPAVVVEAFERRRAYLRDVEGRDDAEDAIVGDCLEIARRSKAGIPGTLAFFVGWLSRATPPTTATGGTP